MTLSYVQEVALENYIEKLALKKVALGTHICVPLAASHTGERTN